MRDARLVPWLALGALVLGVAPAAGQIGDQWGPFSATLHADMVVPREGGEPLVFDVYIGARASGPAVVPSAVAAFHPLHRTEWAVRQSLGDGSFGPWESSLGIVLPPCEGGTAPLDACGAVAAMLRQGLPALAEMAFPDSRATGPLPVGDPSAEEGAIDLSECPFAGGEGRATAGRDARSGALVSGEIAEASAAGYRVLARLSRVAHGAAVPEHVALATGASQSWSEAVRAEWWRTRYERAIARHPLSPWGELVIHSIEATPDGDLILSASGGEASHHASGWVRGTLVGDNGSSYAVACRLMYPPGDRPQELRSFALLCVPTAPEQALPERVAGELMLGDGWHDRDGKWRDCPVVALEPIPIVPLGRFSAMLALSSLPSVLDESGRVAASARAQWLEVWRRDGAEGWRAYQERMEREALVARSAGATPRTAREDSMEPQADAWWAQRHSANLAALQRGDVSVVVHALDVTPEGDIIVSSSIPSVTGLAVTCGPVSWGAGQARLRDADGKVWECLAYGSGVRAGRDGRRYATALFVCESGAARPVGAVDLELSGQLRAGRDWLDLDVVDGFVARNLPIRFMVEGEALPLLSGREAEDIEMRGRALAERARIRERAARRSSP